MARPKKFNIKPTEVKNLAKYGCTNLEIADFYGCDESLLRKSYSEYLTKGRAKGKMRLRQLQWQAAEKGNTSMLIFLGKQMLGQMDNPEASEASEPLPFID